MTHDKMKAVLYICHGSRIREASEQAVSFIHQIMKKVDVPIQEIGFLELSDPTIAQSFERCIKKGATTIVAIPVLLLTAVHAKIDIPKELAVLQVQFPDVEVKLGKPIGVHEKMIDLLLERIADTKISIEDHSMVLLVGRGSSDPDVKRDLTDIGKMLAKRTAINRVEVCFLTAAEPNLEQGLEVAKQTGARQVFVIPYLFFTGILMKKIEKAINKSRNEGEFDSEIILCRYLGYHPIIEEIFNEQIIDLLG